MMLPASDSRSHLSVDSSRAPVENQPLLLSHIRDPLEAKWEYHWISLDIIDIDQHDMGVFHEDF